MEKQVIGFIPPIVGVEEEFNTFRMGKKLTRLVEGEQVFLMNSKELIVFGEAVVVRVDVGTLDEMCVLYGENNHTELGKDPDDAARSLYQTIMKIYGPHLVHPKKIFTVISLRRVNEVHDDSAA